MLDDVVYDECEPREALRGGVEGAKSGIQWGQ
jgi:hypothetical protein